MTPWRHRSGSTLVQVLACCLTAPSHYLNQCWLIISEVLWHAPQRNFTAIDQVDILYNELENYNFEITATSLRGQWVKDCIVQWLLYARFTADVSSLSCESTQFRGHFIQVSYWQHAKWNQYKVTTELHGLSRQVVFHNTENMILSENDSEPRKWCNLCDFGKTSPVALMTLSHHWSV